MSKNCESRTQRPKLRSTASQGSKDLPCRFDALRLFLAAGRALTLLAFLVMALLLTNRQIGDWPIRGKDVRGKDWLGKGEHSKLDNTNNKFLPLGRLHTSRSPTPKYVQSG